MVIDYINILQNDDFGIFGKTEKGCCDLKQSKKGFALVSAIVISVVLFILTAGLITAAMMSMNMTAKNIDQRQAYLNAKSALGFAESYYIDQLLLPEHDEYLSFSSQNGAVSSGADRAGAVINGGVETPPDAETYVKAQYDMAAQTFKLTATARFRSAALDGTQSLQLSCTYDVGYDADGRITTVVKKIETKDKSRYVYIHVKPYDDVFQPYLYTWGYSTGQVEQQPDENPPNTLFSGEWLENDTADGQGNYLYRGPQGAMLRETGGAGGGWNGWYCTEIELHDDNVKYINAIIAKKGALRTENDNTTQSHEIFQLPVPENAGERQDVYITLNSEYLHDFRERDMDRDAYGNPQVYPDSFTEYLTSYVKADYTTVHVRVSGAKDEARILNAPELVMAGAIDDNNLTTVLTKEEPPVKYSGGRMLYEGYGWYRLNVPTKSAFAFSIKDGVNTVFQSNGVVESGVDNQIWITLPTADMGSESPRVFTTEDDAKAAFAEMAERSGKQDKCDYSTVYVKGLALSREDINDVPPVLMNYYVKDSGGDIPVPEPSGKYLLTLKYNDENDTINKKLYDANQAVTLPSLSRAGYTFKGWATSSTKTQPDYRPGDTYIVKGNAYLYGVWEMIEYFVQYDANGGQNPPPTQSFTVEAPAQFASQGNMKNENYAFIGWATARDGAARYKAGDTIDPSVMGSKTSITLYAVWKDSFTVTYDKNGGEGTTPAKQSIRPGSSVALSNGSGLTRKNHKLLGWSEDKDAQSARYKLGQTIVPEDDLTLYAVWEKTSVTIYFSNLRGLTDVKAYVWKKSSGSSIAGWPGEAMTNTGKTVEGYQIYSYEVPLNQGYDQIIFSGNINGGSKQTVDLPLSESKPFFYYRYDNAYDGRNVDKDGKDILISTTGVKTVYFTNRFNWGWVGFYAWGDQGTESSAFPGKKMDDAGTNSYGQSVCRYRYPVGKYYSAIFNSGSHEAKTVDIDISQDVNNQGYYIKDNSYSSPYAVEKYVYDGADAGGSYLSLRAPALANTNALLTGPALQNNKAAVLQGFSGTLSAKSPFQSESLLSVFGGWLRSWLAPAAFTGVQQASFPPLQLLALNETNEVQQEASNPDSVYLAGTFNSWAYDNEDYRLAAADGSLEKFEYTMTLPGGSSYKFNLYDDKTVIGKKGAVFSGETAENAALEAGGQEMSLQTIGTISDRVDVTFTYGRKTTDGKAVYTLKVTQRPSAAKESFNIYIGVSSSIVSSQGSRWKTPDVECRDAGGAVSGYIASAALSSNASRIAYNGGEQDFFLSYAQIPAVRNHIRLSVNTAVLAADFLRNAKEDHLYLLYQKDGGYYLIDNGEYTPSVDGIIDFDGTWTQENVEIASDRGTKVQYYNTYMSKYKNAEDKIIDVTPYNTYGVDQKRAGNSATCYLNDWYTYKIPTQGGSYTLQFTGLNGKENAFVSGTDDLGTEAGRAKLGTSTAVVNSLSGDTWITLNTTENISGKLTDLSVYTYDPEDNYAGKETTVYLDDKALWGGENHDQPVYVYYWGVKTMAWPGKEMKYDEKIGMYYATIPSSSPFLVFNDGTAMDDPACKKTGIQTLQADSTKVRFNNASGQWESYIHPKNALLKAISDGTAALNRSTIQKNTENKTDVVSFTVLETLITEARSVYDYDSFNEFGAYTKLLNTYVADVDKFNDLLREARIYLEGYPEHQYYDDSVTYSEASLANLLDAHTEAMQVFGATDRATAAQKIRSQSSKLRRAIDSLELQLSGGTGVQPGQAVVVLDNQAQWPVLTALGGPGSVEYAAYTQEDDGTITGGASKIENLTQYNSQGYYLYFIDIPAGSDAWAKFRSHTGGLESAQKNGIKAGEVWVYNNKTGMWRENTAGDFQVIGVSTISGKRGEERVYTPKQAGEDFKLSVTYDTTVKYDGTQYVIYAGVYEIKKEQFPAGINLFSPEAKAFFTNPENFWFDNTASSSVGLGWTDADGNLLKTGGAGVPVAGTVNFLIGGKLGASGPGSSGTTPEKAPVRVYFYNTDGRWPEGNGINLNIYNRSFETTLIKSHVAHYFYADIPGNIDLQNAEFGFHTGNYEIDYNSGNRYASNQVDVTTGQTLLFTLGDTWNDTKNYLGTWTHFYPEAVNPDFALDVPEDTPSSGITGADLDAAGQHNLITGNSAPLEGQYTYSAGKINFRWVEGDVLDVTGADIWLNTSEITFACAELSVEKRFGTYLGGFILGREGAGLKEQTVTFYNDVAVNVYNSDGSVSKSDSFTIKNGRYKISGKVNLFEFKKELDKTDGSGKVVSVDSSNFSGGVYGHD